LPGDSASRGSLWLRLILSAVVIAAVFALHYRYVLVHFSIGGTPFDSGWFAWLLGEGDPALTNPKIVNDLSYYNYHVSPYLSALSVLFRFFSVDRFNAFALHQGAVFALLAGSVLALVFGVRSTLLFSAAVLFVLIGDLVLQYATFPHFEIAILSFCLLGAALWIGRLHWLAILAFAVACLVREDGGLFVAATLVAIALTSNPAKALRSKKAMLAAAALVVSAAMFGVKARFFPGFPTFDFNYAGNHWDHVTPAFVLGRLADLGGNPQALNALVSALALAVLSCRYLIFPVLMAPLVVTQLLAVRDLLGHFVFYYAMPFLVISAGQYVVAAIRARQGTLRRNEPVVLLVAAILGSSPLMFAVSLPSSLPMLAATLSQPAPTDLLQIADRTNAAVTAIPDACFSYGVAALIPNSVVKAQLLTPESDLAPCPTVFLFRGDVHYDALKPKVAGWTAGPVIAGRIETYTRP